MDIITIIEFIILAVMVIFMFRIIDRKDTVSKTEQKLYEKEVKRLRRDNENLRRQLELADRYREEYKELCEETKNMHEKYKEQMESVTKIEKEYTEYLEELKRA